MDVREKAKLKLQLGLGNKVYLFFMEGEASFIKRVLSAPGGHSNTSVVHMRNQRFSKHTLIAISPLQEKHTLNENFAPKFTPKQAFLGYIFVGIWKMTPKFPLVESKRTLFLKKRHILTPNTNRV